MNVSMTIKPLLWRASLAASLMLLLSACGANSTNEPIEVAENANRNVIVISNSQFNASNMKLGKLESASFSDVVRSTGMFDVPPEYKASVSAYFGGYVKEIQLLPGQEAKKGQVLFTLENPAYIQTQQEFLEVKSHLRFLKVDYERQKTLAEENISSQKKYLQAETEYQVALSKYSGLQKRLLLMNIDPNSLTEENITSIIIVKSPIGGFITSVAASKGMFLNPSDIAVTITNTEHMHMELNVFEKDLSKIKFGQKVRFQRQNIPNKTFIATISLINKAIEVENRSVLVHCHLDNEDDEALFIPGMYVEAEILTATASHSALPEEAIVQVENNYFVLTKVNSNNGNVSFERKEVKIGLTENGYTAILNSADFPSETEFLVNGAFNLIMG